MRKAWIIVALVMTLGLVVGGAGIAIAAEPNEEPINAPRLLQPVEPEVLPQNLCLIRGTVVNYPAEEGLIVVEGKMLRRPTPLSTPAPEPTEQVFTVMVDENTKYRVPDDREPSLEGILNGDRVAIAAQELENGSLLAKRVVVIPGGVLPHNLCLIRGTVINYPAEEGLIVVEGKMLRRPTLANTSDLSPTGRVFRVTVDENTKYRVPDGREPSLEGVLYGDRVAIAAQELENGSLLAKRVVVTPGEVRVIRLRNALLVIDQEREIMALVIPQKQIAIIAKPIKIVPFRELPFDQELLPLELPSLLEPQ